MKIVIVENELYLAQSIATKLVEHGFKTEIYSSVKEATLCQADVYLLSTNLPGQSTAPLINAHKDKIIIMMVNYINNDTVSEPLKLGAKDYILKPFMIEELIRKIEHYKTFQNIQIQTNIYQEYIDKLLEELKLDTDIDAITPPIVVQTNYQRLIDKLVFSYIKKHNIALAFLPLDDPEWREKLEDTKQDTLLYITGVEALKKGEKEELLQVLERYNFILCATVEFESPYKTLTINTESKLYDQNEVLTIDEYVKYIINTFQYKFPDTELSKKLGISRKSLWEKRKKYELFKKK